MPPAYTSPGRITTKRLWTKLSSLVGITNIKSGNSVVSFLKQIKTQVVKRKKDISKSSP